MMIRTLSLLSVLLLSACATITQKPLTLEQSFLTDTNPKKIGIISTKTPQPTVHLPGASCLLCIGVAKAAHSSMIDRAKTFSTDDVKLITTAFKNKISQENSSIIYIDTPLNLSKLKKKKNKNKIENIAKHDYSQFINSHNLTHLLVFNVHALGIERPYAGYVPTGDPAGYFNGTAYLVDLSTNKYEWYTPAQVRTNAGSNWKESPSYPALTNAYYQSVEKAKNLFLETM